MAGIDREAWETALHELETPLAAPENAITTREFATLLGVGLTTAKTRMRQLVKAKRAKVVWKEVVDGRGTRQRVPAYRLVEEKADEVCQIGMDDGWCYTHYRYTCGGVCPARK